MTLVAGASQYLASSTLANAKGTAPSIPTLLSQATDISSLLDSGREAVRIRGLGISSSARVLNQQFLQRTSDVNQLFSLGAGTDATVEGALQNILALRAQTSTDRLASSLIEVADSGDVAADSTKGTNVDTSA
mgnify:FL=1